MTQSFAELFEQSLQQEQFAVKQGSIIKGTVVAIQKGFVIVDAGLKSESAIPAEEFYNNQGELEVKIGDEVEVSLDSIEDGSGETRLSREKAKRSESWRFLEQAYENQDIVTGYVSSKVKGGFTVELDGVKAFLPGSLVDTKPIKETLNIEGQTLELKVVKLDQKRNNVVVSRKAVIEKENSHEREQLLATLEEGSEVKGIVKNITDYGAFIDLGGVDGLLHITDLSWKRIKHPSEIINIGDEITAKVLKFDREKSRVSLGLKQLQQDPWSQITEQYKVGDKLVGKVSNLTDYGCFVEILNGIEGLVHISEMDWTNKNIHPSKVVSIGDEVEVMILEIDESRRRISLGIKQCKENPWVHFAENNSKGQQIEGVIKSITDFGIFIGLEGGIDGLVHLSDISWSVPGEVAVRDYKKGDTVTAVVLQVDADKERISLGIKQLGDDPFASYTANIKKGDIIKATVTEVDSKGAKLSLADGVVGFIRASELAKEKVSDPTEIVKVGDEIEAKFVGIDRKNNLVNLSIKAKDEEEEKVAIKSLNKKEDSPTTTSMAEAFKKASENE